MNTNINKRNHLWATLQERAILWGAVEYEPSQMSEFHQAANDLKLLAGGEGAGKSIAGAMEVVGELTYWDLVFLVAPAFEQAKKEFDYIADALMRIGAVRKTEISSPERGQRSLKTVTGGRVVTISSEEGTKAITGTGEEPDMIIMCEAGKNTREIYLACLGRLARRGGKLIMTGTFESSIDWYASLFNRWQNDNPEGGRSFSVPTWKNLFLYPGGENDPKILLLKQSYPDDLFQERFGAKPCPPANLVLKEFDVMTHISSNVVFDPELPVSLWIDPGYSGSHYAVEVVQFVGNEVHIIDEIYTQLALAHRVVDEAKKREWWSKVSGGVIDVAGRSHGLGMPSNVEVWNELASVYLASRVVGIEDGIMVHRRFLKDPLTGKPRLYLNPKCKGAITEYQSWKRKEIAPEIYGEPVKYGCDALKAINYGLVNEFGFVDRTEPETNEQAEIVARQVEDYYDRLANFR